jgi:small subunit ribosomal protein S2
MTVSVDQILEAKVHIGTLKNEAHPKTQKYWAGVFGGIVVIDPDQIVQQLDAAKAKIQSYKKEWKQILIVAEKQMYRKELESLAIKAWVHYLNHKVPAGFITNFDTLAKRIATMNDLRSFIASDDFVSLTKKEQLTHKRKLAKAERVYKGVTELKNAPDLVIVVDGQMMTSLIQEIDKKSIDSIVIASTNFSKFWNVNKLVMANIAGYKSIDFVLQYILS